MRKIRMIGLAALASTAALVAAAPLSATPDPINTCPGGAKIDPVADGTYHRTLNGSPITITLNVNESAKTFNFTTSWAVTSVLVKGGTGALTYSYPYGKTHGYGLHSPFNVKNGEYYGLSHVCFFSTKGGKDDKGGKK